jgi:hypothetical protein
MRTGEGAVLVNRHPSQRPEAAFEVEALVTDRYLDALLAAVERRAPDVPADAHLEPAVRDAALALQHALVRVHPSFRFEERLAGRLGALGRMSSGEPAAGEVVPFPPAVALLPGHDPELALVLEGRLDPAAPESPVLWMQEWVAPARPLLVGGAITSAALSLVGVAWMAWRATRPGDPAGPAVRARHGRRAALGAWLPFVGGAGGPA